MAKLLHITVKTLKSLELYIIPSKVSTRLLWYTQEIFGVAPFYMLAYKLDDIFKKLTRNDKYLLMQMVVILTGEEKPDAPNDKTSA